MKLVKLTDDHYVVVDETIQPVNGYYYDAFINKIKSTNGAEYGEASHCWQITHSTQPFEHGTEPFADGVQYVKIYNKVNPLSLQEVKELIGEVDVMTKAVRDVEGTSWDEDAKPSFLSGYLRGYRQALEDNKEKKYTEEDLRKAIQLAWEADSIDGTVDLNIVLHYGDNNDLRTKWSEDEIIKSLQPKTEWEVEIIDGKLKLK